MNNKFLSWLFYNKNQRCKHFFRIMNILGGGTPRCIYYVSEQNGYVNGTNILDSPKDIGGSLWQSAYLDLNDLLIIKKNAIQSEAWTYVGIADLLSAINYMILCDNFGDIPYSEAFKSDISNPKFDSAESIYSKIDETIDEAISYFAKPISTIEPKNDDMEHFNQPKPTIPRIKGGNGDIWSTNAHGKQIS